MYIKITKLIISLIWLIIISSFTMKVIKNYDKFIYKTSQVITSNFKIIITVNDNNINIFTISVMIITIIGFIIIWYKELKEALYINMGEILKKDK